MANDTIQSRYDWHFAFDGDAVLNKEELIRQYIAYMFDRTQSMFKYKGLPETIPQKELEKYLQLYGRVFLIKSEGKWYATFGSFGGEMNPYYIPKDAYIVNPWLKGVDGNYEIGKDCYLIRNDYWMVSLLPLARKYATLLAEADISLRMALINSRIRKTIVCDNDKTKAEVDQYLKNIEEGKSLASIGAKAFFDGIKIEEGSSSGMNQIKEIIEAKQYLVSQWFIDLGLNSNFNMKREAINSAESGMNEDILLPLVDQMVKERKEGFDLFNKSEGLNIEVELNSSWEEVHKEVHEHTTEGTETKEDEGEPQDDSDNERTE